MALQGDSSHDEDSSSLVPPPLPPACEPPDPVTLLSIPPQTVPSPAPKLDSIHPATSTIAYANAANDSPNPAAVSTPAPASNSAQNGDGKDSEANGDMSGHHHYPGGPGSHQHGQPAPYATSSAAAYSPSPAVSLSPNPYTSYSPTTIVTQPGDPYRPNSVVGSSMPLPSMRTIDQAPQQAVASHLSHSPMGMGMNMASAPVPSSMPFYPHQSMVQSAPYGLPGDPMGRYPLPHDPRLLGSRGPKKVRARKRRFVALDGRGGH